MPPLLIISETSRNASLVADWPAPQIHDILTSYLEIIVTNHMKYTFCMSQNPNNATTCESGNSPQNEPPSMDVKSPETIDSRIMTFVQVLSPAPSPLAIG